MLVMVIRHFRSLVVGVLFVVTLACASTHDEAGHEGRNAPPDPKPEATPSKNFTAADVAKLKWIEGTWKGMDGDKPFYERYKIEGTTMIVEGLKEDGTPDGEPGRFELRDGEFGKTEGDRRSAASEITADYVQFVPAVNGKGNSFRFHRQSDGTWHAILEWAGADKKPQQKIYKMERWQPK